MIKCYPPVALCQISKSILEFDIKLACLHMVINSTLLGPHHKLKSILLDTPLDVALSYQISFCNPLFIYNSIQVKWPGREGES